MCLPFCFGWQGKPQPSKATTTPSPPGAADLPKATANKPISPKPAAAVTPQLEQQLPPVPESLPSQVDETLAECPRFRIVLVGNSGVGKSSLVQSIFKINSDQIDIAHGRPGDADIEREYTSPENPRFILHDSKGFEVGTEVNWDTVRKFLENRRKKDLPERIHAIWLCIETPRNGGRLLQTGDERLLELAKEFDIPLIAVFTKYDRLVIQFLIQDSQPRDDAERNASGFFDCSVKELQEKSPTNLPIACVKVSTTDINLRKTLIDLTNETRNRLHEVEDKLRVLWVTAQQVNAQQKVEVSISEGFKKYWRDLGQSSEFEGQILIDCVHRIHDDVLKVWNFNDPTKILSGTDFFTQMINLLKPLIDNCVKQTPFATEPVPGFGSMGATVLVSLREKFKFQPASIQYLYDKYQKFPSTAKILATYIINLVLILHDVFTNVLSEPPRALSNDLVGELIDDNLRKPALDVIDIANSDEVIDIIKKRLTARDR